MYLLERSLSEGYCTGNKRWLLQTKTALDSGSDVFFYRPRFRLPELVLKKRPLFGVGLKYLLEYINSITFQVVIALIRIVSCGIE